MALMPKASRMVVAHGFLGMPPPVCGVVSAERSSRAQANPRTFTKLQRLPDERFRRHQELAGGIRQSDSKNL
jgi:hypothetical protein